MIFDSIKNIDKYNFNEGILKALETASKLSKDNYNTDKIVLENGDFILPKLYKTNVSDSLVFEAHKKYIDVMYMLDGEEMIMVKPTDSLTNITSEYKEEDECLLAEENADISSILLKTGEFIVLYPQDAHCPACAIDGVSKEVKKVICKVQV